MPSLLLFKANKTHAQNFHTRGFAGGVPETPKDPPRKTSGCDAKKRGSGVCSFFAPKQFGAVVFSPPPGWFCHRHIAVPQWRGDTAFLSGCTRSGKASGRAWDESPCPFLQSSSNSRIPERHSENAGANPADCTNFRKYTKFKKRTKCAAVADKQCSGLQNRIMRERYPPAVPF
jgi:hypothetical protein